MTARPLTRRRFLASAGATGLAAASGIGLPAYSRAAERPVFTHGVQSGDVTLDSAMVWARADRPARVLCEIATSESFADAVRLPPVDALPATDLAMKRLVTGLPSGQDIFYRLTLADLAETSLTSEPIVGRFRTAPASRRNVRFAWSADTVGQGYGIDATGMKTYSTMLGRRPDFFLHSGDTIYADNPLKDEIVFKDGTKWVNAIVTDEKRKVAETLDEFRGQWKYNLLDRHLRAFNAEVPMVCQWDDHEVINNWYPEMDLSADDRYREKSVPLLAARAARAFHEMTPISYMPAEPGRIYRKIAYGPLLDVFFLDMRSYRGPNTAPMGPTLTPEARLLGADQVAWLKRALAASTATWKVIASDMPLGLIVWDNFMTRTGTEAVADGVDAPPRGRELEIAELLRFISAAGIRNTVWLTADVHYAAAHYYDPSRAKFQDFAPFWEFVAGPLHAGTFGPNALDPTFGPEVKFMKVPTPEQGINLPPSAGLQFFGLVDIDGGTGQMTVRLIDRDDTELYAVTLDPVRA